MIAAWPSATLPGSAHALDSALAGLGWLATAPMGGRPAPELAACLRGLERAESMLTAARASVLAAFAAQDGCASDGHGSVRTWLTWQARVTRGAAAGAVGWMRRLADHPDVGEELAAGQMSASWAREVCGWTDRLPADRRGDADVILLSAARGGADLQGLAALAEEMFRRCAGPDTDGDDRFSDRGVMLDRTIGGAGRLTGDLTPGCAAALSAVLAALGAKAGPEDDRTRCQRDHDALQEACRRLVGAGCLPDRAGQPTQIRLNMTLEQLRGLPGAPEAEAAWAAAGWTRAEPGADCDAQIAPQVDGYLNPQALDQLTTTWLRRQSPGAGAGAGNPGSGAEAIVGSAGTGLPPDSRARLAGSLLGLAIDALSGPSGLAAWLRTGLLDGYAATKSLPLDLGKPTEIIPPQLRRAVAGRDTHCAFPGCDQPPRACQVHHLVPRSDGGTTGLQNLILLCSFHHLIAVHRWGWQLTLNTDGTVTARRPDGRILRSTGPPGSAA